MSKSFNSGTSYRREYENLRGIDLSGNSKNAENTFAYIENMYVDYEGGGLESIPGFRKILSTGEKINGIFSQKSDGREYIIIHSGDKLYRFPLEERDTLSALTPIASGLSNSRSSLAVIDETLYISDGEKITVVDADGTAGFVGDSNHPPYIPTTHINGEKYEPRNLLTPRFIQKFRLSDPDEYAFSTANLKFIITDYEKKTCALSGAAETVSGDIYIPEYTKIGGTGFKITAIADSAFENNTEITGLFTSSGLEVIGHKAFAGCSALITVVLSKTVKSIETYCFDRCSALRNFYIGEGFKKFGTSPFNLCTSLHTFYYAKSEDSLELIEGRLEYEDRDVICNTPYKAIRMLIPLSGSVKTVTAVSVDGTNITFRRDTNDLLISQSDRTLIEGKEISVYGLFNSLGDGFLETPFGQKIPLPENNIYGCKSAVCFDDRIFLSANPKIPGVIFYSGIGADGIHRPFYFSTENYIIDNSGASPLAALYSNGESLMALYSGGGAGSIFIHGKTGTADNRSYSAEYIKAGISVVGEAISFMGEDLFVSSLGISTLVQDGTEGNLRLCCRSLPVSRLLLSENPNNIRLSQWRGYLIISCGGRFYLADSRDRTNISGDSGYKWYILDGIGTYTLDSVLFKYHSIKKPGFEISEYPDMPVESEVISEMTSPDEYDFFVRYGEEKIRVYPTEQRIGGDFHPATEVKAFGDLLFFGTDSGDICIFNNDMRGVPPAFLSETEGFDPEEYRRTMGEKIHPYFYAFHDHAAKYTMMTAPDDAGFPGLEKSTITASTALEIGGRDNSEISLSVKTDGEKEKLLCKIKGGALDFSSFDFSVLNFAGDDGRLSLSEDTKGWVQKQYIIESEGFRAPIKGLSIAYLFKIKGKIKNK